MKFSEQWLREWVNPPVDTQQLAEQLTMSGLEVESIAPVAEDFNKVIIGHIVEAEQHPNAERLRVCQVDIGANEPLTIVCGAANARANLKVPVAVVGASLPNDLKIQAAKLRGVASQGMICSPKELGLAETSEGIMELPEDTPIGEDFRTWLKLDDKTIDLHITPNRGDCLSIAGIAREVAVLNDCDYSIPAVEAVTPTVYEQFPIQVLAAKECPRYLGRVIHKINSKAQTPIWMVERLRRCGLRAVHPVVDVTNYVLLELGQPLHAFDLAKLKGQITVRLAHQGEALVLLDEQSVTLDQETLIIADEKQPLALAGIMGGLNSAVTTTTTEIFLESAYFDPITIAGKARRYGLDTDAAYRFERGVDPNLSERAIERATQLLLEIVGGEVGPVFEATTPTHLPKTTPIALRLARIHKILGTPVTTEMITTILQRLGIRLQPQEGGWLATPPSYRFDLALEEDLIEEIIRVYGYEQVPVKVPQAKLHFMPQSEQQLSLVRLRKFLVDRGYHEAITYSFISPKWQQLLDPDQQALSLTNPISADLAVMRTGLWPGLLNAVNYNQSRQQLRVRIFETGLRFRLTENGLLQEPMIAGVISGEVFPEQWGVNQKAVDFFDLKGDVETLLSLTERAQEFQFVAAHHPALHPEQSCIVKMGEQTIGYMGALHPALLPQLDLIGPIYLFELELKPITKIALPQYKIISKFPAIRRDLSFVVDREISAQQILEVIRVTAGELLSDVNLFDVYQGEGIALEKRSLALGLIWQTAERTLVDKEINERMEEVTKALKEKFGVSIRD